MFSCIISPIIASGGLRSKYEIKTLICYLYYSVKENNKYEASFSGEPVYEHIRITPTSLSIHTFYLHSGEGIDSVEIVRESL